MCGEHRRRAKSLSFCGGSSPRVRGTFVYTSFKPDAAGIIPACAGNMPFRRGDTLMAEDHPRVCGEHEAMRLVLGDDQGSSPRVRGTSSYDSGRGGHHGIIPACAGNILIRFRAWRSSWDHPRVCGEHLFTDVNIITHPGSSPRVRGTLRFQPCQQALRGIIPACAGNIDRFTFHLCKLRDHPRVCGEHFNRDYEGEITEGSSPRVRGTF